jgi:CheY-like chemotaxis protein
MAISREAWQEFDRRPPARGSGAALPRMQAGYRSSAGVVPRTERRGEARDVVGEGPRDERVMVLAPTAVDAGLGRSLLADTSLSCLLCSDLSELCQTFGQHVGAILLDGEVLGDGDSNRLAEAMRRQPGGCDVPIVLLTAGADSPVTVAAAELLGNVTVLARPVRPATVVGVLRTALSNRRRVTALHDRSGSRRANGERSMKVGSAGRVGCRIVVADDNRDAADSLTMLLRLMGHEVRTAYDGEEAVGLAEAFRPDLVMLDIGMPWLDGYQAAGRIRRQDWGQDLVIVAVTGWGQDEDRRRTAEAGFHAHLVKPVDPDTLESLVGAVAVREPGSVPLVPAVFAAKRDL